MVVHCVPNEELEPSSVSVTNDSFSPKARKNNPRTIAAAAHDPTTIGSDFIFRRRSLASCGGVNKKVVSIGMFLEGGPRATIGPHFKMLPAKHNDVKMTLICRLENFLFALTD